MTDTINGRTLDEIKKALQCRVKGCSEKCDHRCDMCELYVPNYRLEDRYADAHAYIQQLELRLAHVERERDAAVQTVHGLCHHCKNGRSEKCQKCLFWPSRVYFVSTETYVDHWEWRGVCEENAKEES